MSNKHKWTLCIFLQTIQQQILTVPNYVNALVTEKRTSRVEYVPVIQITFNAHYKHTEGFTYEMNMNDQLFNQIS